MIGEIFKIREKNVPFYEEDERRMKMGMDELKLKLSTNFMRNLVSKIISKIIFNKLGVKPKIQLNEIEVEMADGNVRFHVSVDGELDEASFIKAIQLSNLD